MPLMIGVGNIARNVTDMYIGVNRDGGDNAAARVLRGWVGVNGAARQFYGPPVYTVTWEISGIWEEYVQEAIDALPWHAEPGDIVEVYFPRQGGLDPGMIQVEGVGEIHPHFGNQGGVYFQFEMPAQSIVIYGEYP